MDLRSPRARLVLASVALAVAACSGQAPPAGQARRPAAAQPRIGYADIGGYRLAYECAGRGGPTVILEAGYTASGIDTYGRAILPALARRTRVCTYDRAGDGLSDARPASVRPLTSIPGVRPEPSREAGRVARACVSAGSRYVSQHFRWYLI